MQQLTDVRGAKISLETVNVDWTKLFEMGASQPANPGEQRIEDFLSHGGTPIINGMSFESDHIRYHSISILSRFSLTWGKYFPGAPIVYKADNMIKRHRDETLRGNFDLAGCY